MNNIAINCSNFRTFSLKQQQTRCILQLRSASLVHFAWSENKRKQIMPLDGLQKYSIKWKMNSSFFCRHGSDKEPWILIFALCKISTDLKIYPFWYVKWLALVMSVKPIENGTNFMLYYSLSTVCFAITLSLMAVFTFLWTKVTAESP